MSTEADTIRDAVSHYVRDVQAREEHERNQQFSPQLEADIAADRQKLDGELGRQGYTLAAAGQPTEAEMIGNSAYTLRQDASQYRTDIDSLAEATQEAQVTDGGHPSAPVLQAETRDAALVEADRRQLDLAARDFSNDEKELQSPALSSPSLVTDLADEATSHAAVKGGGFDRAQTYGFINKAGQTEALTRSDAHSIAAQNGRAENFAQNIAGAIEGAEPRASQSDPAQSADSRWTAAQSQAIKMDAAEIRDAITNYRAGLDQLASAEAGADKDAGLIAEAKADMAAARQEIKGASEKLLADEGPAGARIASAAEQINASVTDSLGNLQSEAAARDSAVDFARSSPSSESGTRTWGNSEPSESSPAAVESALSGVSSGPVGGDLHMENLSDREAAAKSFQLPENEGAAISEKDSGSEREKAARSWGSPSSSSSEQQTNEVHEQEEKAAAQQEEQAIQMM